MSSTTSSSGGGGGLARCDLPQNLSANGISSSSFTPPGSASNKDANSPPPRDSTNSPPQNSNWSFEEQFKQVRQVSDEDELLPSPDSIVVLCPAGLRYERHLLVQTEIECGILWAAAVELQLIVNTYDQTVTKWIYFPAVPLFFFGCLFRCQPTTSNLTLIVKSRNTSSEKCIFPSDLIFVVRLGRRQRNRDRVIKDLWIVEINCVWLVGSCVEGTHTARRGSLIPLRIRILITLMIPCRCFAYDQFPVSPLVSLHVVGSLAAGNSHRIPLSDIKWAMSWIRLEWGRERATVSPWGWL